MQTIKPGEKAFIKWDADPLYRANLEKAIEVAKDFLKMGVEITGCSLDKFIHRSGRCPVCGKPGLLGE